MVGQVGFVIWAPMPIEGKKAEKYIFRWRQLILIKFDKKWIVRKKKNKGVKRNVDSEWLLSKKARCNNEVDAFCFPLESKSM